MSRFTIIPICYMFCCCFLSVTISHAEVDSLTSSGSETVAAGLRSLNIKNMLVDKLTPVSADVQVSGCQLVKIVHLLNHPGCLQKAISSFACFGSCPSHVKISSTKFWQHERSCSCCQQTESQEATVTLDCPSLDPPYRKVKTNAPVDCLCRACTDLSREDLRAQEYVEALANELGTESMRISSRHE